MARVLASGGPATAVLADDRWYHALDKGYGGRAVHDPDGLAAPLARWFTDHRFDPGVVRVRLARAWREAGEAERRLRAAIQRDDPADAVRSGREAVKWLQTWHLERWGERDASLGRIGTRFERLAVERGRPELPALLDGLGDLDEASVERRLAAAPAWVWERHDRSFRARRHVGEAVSRLQDARDTLRVCSLYELRRVVAAPIPAWLAVPNRAAELGDKAARLASLTEVCFDDAS